jgi:VanZ family protein
VKRVLGFAPAAAWALGILWLGSLPNLRPPLDTALPIDLVGHFGMFAVLGALLAFGLHRVHVRASIAWPLAAGILIGALDELHQRSVPGRTSTLSDLVADALGCAVGLWLAHRWFGRVKTPRPHLDSDAGRRTPDADFQEHSA